MFLHMSVILSRRRGSLNDVTSCLAAWFHVPSGRSLPGEVSVGGGGALCQGDSPYSEKWTVCILLECFLVTGITVQLRYPDLILLVASSCSRSLSLSVAEYEGTVRGSAQLSPL